ncbi:hypothetical protein [Rubellimicrobium sp. CFH 75288]|uniref:phage portal protein family protein n=1 Tax=Rubellimicrobium sp. CFH 75288 TaxID=2697034 RepID=UPI001412C2F1|nr:hypothetical protein [Rubellimicrobium sp. CFH 75288]NAZ37162.1 hypothetical protein [Rubellimicrobium sp. CFH 75288]
MAETFEAVIAEIATMFVYGYAPMEITLKRRAGPNPRDPLRHSRFSDGRIGIASLALRAQTSITRWDVDDRTGEIRGLWQQPISGPEIYLPAEKILLFRTTEERNNPEGRSLLRSAYRDWYFKKRIEEIEAIGVERDLAGLPVALMPSRFFAADADPAEKRLLQAWQTLVTSIRRDQREGVIIPSDRDASGHPLFDLKLLSSGGARTFDTTRIIDRRSRAMATSVLADFLFLGQQAVGSFALSSDKTALFATAVGAFARSICAVFNRRLVPLLWEANGWKPDALPMIVCGDIENPNIADLAQLLGVLAGAGATLFPDRELENHLRKLMGLPLAPEDDGLGADPAAGGTPADFGAIEWDSAGDEGEVA